MIFVDSNIPMYLVGSEHPHKAASRQLLESAILSGARLVTSTEVLQEILHRYTAIRRREAIDPAFHSLLMVVDDVLEVTVQDLLLAKRRVLESPEWSARDALHLAVMHRAGIHRIMSFDRGFDREPGILRLYN